MLIATHTYNQEMYGTIPKVRRPPVNRDTFKAKLSTLSTYYTGAPKQLGHPVLSALEMVD